MSRYSEMMFGMLVLCFAIALFVISGDVRDFTHSKIDAAFMPRIAAGLLVVLGISTVLSGWRLPTSVSVQKQKTRSGVPFVLASMGLMLAYVACLDSVGFVICSVSYVLGQILLLRKQAKKHWLMFLSVALLVPVVAYVLFVYVFEVMVPAGVLG